LCETWLSSNTESGIVVARYRSVFKSRTNKSGGGIGFLGNEEIKFTVRNDLSRTLDYIECMFIEITQLRKCNVLLGCVYRPPYTDHTNTEMLVILDNINNEKSKNVCIAGDYNLDLLKEQTHTPTSDFLTSFLTYSFAPVIHVPTRITDTTSTLIGKIFINRHELPHSLAVVVSDILDHLPIVLHLPMKLSGISPRPSHPIPTRNYSPTNILSFKTALGQMEWKDVKLYTDMKDTESAYNCFHTTYKSQFDLVSQKKL